MAEELKSCPFCGGRSHHILGARQIRMLDVVKCLDCFAEIQGTYEPESALIKWNTRAQLPSQGGEAVAIAWQRLSGDYHEVGYSRLTDDQKRRGWQERPLYTHPADQVADDLTMVKVSRELLERIIKRGMRLPDETQHQHLEELRAILEAKDE